MKDQVKLTIIKCIHPSSPYNISKVVACGCLCYNIGTTSIIPKTLIIFSNILYVITLVTAKHKMILNRVSPVRILLLGIIKRNMPWHNHYKSWISLSNQTMENVIDMMDTWLIIWTCAHFYRINSNNILFRVGYNASVLLRVWKTVSTFQAHWNWHLCLH